MKTKVVVLLACFVSSFASAAATSFRCQGSKVWVAVWQQQDSLKTRTFVMATANRVGEESSRYGNLFGPEVLKKPKDKTNYATVSDLLQQRVAVSNELWGKEFSLDLGKGKRKGQGTFTYRHNGVVQLVDNELVCELAK